MKLTDYHRNVHKNWSLLLLGDPGTGKTTLCSTAPGKVYFFCFEDGLTSVCRTPELLERVDYDLYLPAPHMPVPKNLAEKQKATSWPGKGWEDACVKLRDLASKPGMFDVVVIDSLTSLSQVCLEKILAEHAMLGEAVVSKDTLVMYQTLGQRSLQFFYGVLGLPGAKIFTAHETYDRDETTGKIVYRVQAEGKMFGERLSTGKDFTEVWRTIRTVPKEGPRKFFVDTQSLEKFPCKSRWGCLEALEQPDISKLLEKVKVEFKVTG